MHLTSVYAEVVKSVIEVWRVDRDVHLQQAPRAMVGRKSEQLHKRQDLGA